MHVGCGVVGVQALLCSPSVVILPSCSLASGERWHPPSGWYRLSPISALICQSQGTSQLEYSPCFSDVEERTAEHKVGALFFVLSFQHAWSDVPGPVGGSGCWLSIAVVFHVIGHNQLPGWLVGFFVCSFACFVYFIGICALTVQSWTSCQNSGPHPRLWRLSHRAFSLPQFP